MSRRSISPPAAVAVVVAMALGAAACGPTTPPLTDPVEIIQKGAASLAALKTVHLRGAADGQVALGVGGVGGGAPLTLDGTTIDGDIDVTGEALSLEVIVSLVPGLRVSLVAVDGSTYLRAPILTGQRWLRQPANGGLGGDPAALMKGLSALLARPDIAPQKLADARCAGTDCYQVRFAVPAADVREALGSLGSAIPGLSGNAVGDVTVTAGVRRDSLRLATLGLDVPTGGSKPLSIRLELSKYDEPVTIAAPPADQVTDSPGG